MTGEIFNIQKFCTNDGPGIRTTVFFKGCPLSCLWCHNPESHAKEKQIMFYADKCTNCGRCKNSGVDNTTFVCFNGAKEICGNTVSSDYVVNEIMKDFLFYKNSGGGVTLSGGEPLFQFEFALDILKKCKENNIHTAIETCGYVSTDKISEIAEYTDLFLYDFKETNPQKHKNFTGADNNLILKNLFELDKLQKEIILRCPIILGFNDRKEHFDKICELTNSFEHISEINIEPYHSFGESKYEALGKKRPKITIQTDEQINEIIEYISSKTDKKVRRS